MKTEIEMARCECGDCGRYYFVQENLLYSCICACPYCGRDTIRAYISQCDAAERRASSLKGVITKLRKRLEER
jgi:hypothetical protein